MILYRKRNFEEADKIRRYLAENGIELMDQANEWRSMDGKMAGMQSFDRQNGWMDGWMGRWIDGWEDGWLDGKMDGKMGG